MEALQDQEATEDLGLSFEETPIVATGATVERAHLSRPQELAAARLDEIKDEIRQEMEDMALLISAEGDQLSYEASQADRNPQRAPGTAAWRTWRPRSRKRRKNFAA